MEDRLDARMMLRELHCEVDPFYHYLESQDFQLPIAAFVDREWMRFSCEEASEDVRMAIHEAFGKLVADLLAQYAGALQGEKRSRFHKDVDQILARCRDFGTEEQRWKTYEEYLSSSIDFGVFEAMMARNSRDAQLHLFRPFGISGFVGDEFKLETHGSLLQHESGERLTERTTISSVGRISNVAHVDGDPGSPMAANYIDSLLDSMPSMSAFPSSSDIDKLPTQSHDFFGFAYADDERHSYQPYETRQQCRNMAESRTIHGVRPQFSSMF